MSENIVIAINREYGSGGKTIGEMLSKDLGIHYYDKEILHLAADVSGINEALFVTKDEDTTARASLLRAASKVYNGELISPGSKDFTSEQNLFNYQAKVIRTLAETESCIVVGRCADYILKDYENVISVFVHAPKPFLLEQAAKKKNLSGAALEKYVDQINKNRMEYHNRFTGQEWSDAHYYDLCLNSSKLGFEKCVEIIKGYIKVKYGHLPERTE